MNEEENPFRKMQRGEIEKDIAAEGGLPKQNLPDSDNESKTLPKKQARPQIKRPVGEPRETRPEVGTTAHTERKPVYKAKLKQTPTRDGYYRRWVNDEGDELQSFAEGGYTKVNDRSGKPMTRRAKPGVKAYLLEIKQELYDQDQQEKWKEWNQITRERLKPREGQGYYTPKTKHQYR